MKKVVFIVLFLSLILAGCSGDGQNSPAAATLLPPAAAIKVQQYQAESLGVGPEWVTIVDIQSKQWSNSCLDAQAPDELCAQQITPGYRIVLTYGGETFVFHTNLEGSHIREVTQQPEPSEAALQSRQLLAGYLGYDPESIRIVSEESVLFADSCLEIAIPETVCAQVQVRGKRVILEVDRVQFEFHSAIEPINPKLAAVSGIKGGDAVLMFSREGGSDNSCDNLNVTLSGYVIQYSCRNVPGEAPGITLLPEEDQARVLKWVLAYAPYDVTQTRQDGMKLRVTFTGSGTENAAFAEQETIREFCEALMVPPAPLATPLPTVGSEG